MTENKKGFTLIKSLVLLMVALLISIPAGVASAASLTTEETEAARIAEALHSVKRAAKQYQAETGKEATGIDQLATAGMLKNPDKDAMIVVNDSWQVWGDGTGAYVMWNKTVSPEVCKRLNPGGTLPTDMGKPDPGKGFQCVYEGVNEYYILEPIYIHNKTAPPAK